MLEQYRESAEGYPESVAMVVWAGNTLKTCGEDFAECLHLMGVRPVYLGQSSRVTGMEAIPLEELGRPWLDVTLRISGLFRDIYPNLIRLMDEAVSCIAALDESEEENYRQCWNDCGYEHNPVGQHRRKYHLLLQNEIIHEGGCSKPALCPELYQPHHSEEAGRTG